jgi:hypothetical protein
LNALVERLTDHRTIDEEFVSTFMLTYRSFTNSKILIDLIISRFSLQPPFGIGAAEKHEWTEKKLRPVRLRVYTVLKSWLNSYIKNDEMDGLVLVTIQEFAENVMKPHMAVSASSLIKLIEIRRKDELKPPRAISVFQKEVPPSPILPKNLKKFKLYEIEPLELARQITLYVSALYQKIDVQEYLAKTWSLDGSFENMEVMIETSNQITKWVEGSILATSDLKKRVKSLGYFISLANVIKP